jgi:hypothetical protein
MMHPPFTTDEPGKSSQGGSVFVDPVTESRAEIEIRMQLARREGGVDVQVDRESR